MAAYFFYGGPLHGEIVAMPDPPPRIFDAWVKREAPPLLFDPMPEPPPPWPHVTYHLVQLKGPRGARWLEYHAAGSLFPDYPTLADPWHGWHYAPADLIQGGEIKCTFDCE